MKNVRQTLFPVLAAMIWGFAFSAQQICAEYGMKPFTFNLFRSLIGFAALFFVSVFFAGGFKKLFARWADRPYRRGLLWGGLLCGLALFLASFLQQASFGDAGGGTESGKVGFLTVLYVVLVPLLGLFLKKKVTPNVWVSVVLAAVGLYFLCLKPGTGLSVSRYDLLALGCAFVYALHILLIDRFAALVDGVQLSMAQFFFASLFCVPFAAFDRTLTADVFVRCLPYVCYMGLMSSGIAYTLQILAQKDANPTVVTLLLSLESVFAVIAGALVQHQVLSGREYLGCFIMFAAVLLAQIPWKGKRKKAGP